MFRVFRLVTCVILLTGLFFAEPSPRAALSNAPGDVLHVAVSEPGTIDPALASYTNEIQVIGHLFSGLVRIDPVSGDVLPDLASSWSWASSTEVTFTLRSGLVWSDGQALTAADARFGILRALAPDMHAPYASMLFPILNAEAYNSGSITDDTLVGIYADDDTHLRIKLAYPMAFFEKVMALWVAYPTPSQAIALHPATWTLPENIVTSGPYRLAEWTPGSRITLTASPSYYGEQPNIPTVEVKLNGDSEWAWKEYLLGNLDATPVGIGALATILGDPLLSAQLNVVPSTCSWFMDLNTSSPPFDNLNVRKAFIAAVDRQSFVDNLMGGGPIPTQTMIPPTIFGAVDGPAAGIGIPFDAVQARAYLTAAGYPNGTGFPVVDILVRDTARNQANWNFLKAAWSSVLNVTVNVEYVASVTTLQPMALVGWCADYNEGYNYVNDGIEVNRARLGGWTNSTYQALMNQIASTTVPADRLPLYAQAEEIITETDAVIGPLYVNTNLEMVRPYLTRTFANFGADTWHLWTITRDEVTTYSPGSPQVFAPAMDNTSYDLPADLFTQETTLTHTVLRTEEAAPTPTGMAGIGSVFRLDATPVVTGPRRALEPAANPYTIKVSYSDEQLGAEGVRDPATMALYASVDGKWVEQTTIVDPANHLLTATTSEINTTFVVWGRQAQVFLPAIRR